MTVILPHSFKDGVGETASGVQVMDNLEALKGAIDAIQALILAGPGEYTLTEVQINRGLNVLQTPSTTRAAMVFLSLRGGPAADAICQIKLNGTGLFENGVYMTSEKMVPVTFIVPANGTWLCEPTAGPMNLLGSTYLLLPKK